MATYQVNIINFSSVPSAPQTGTLEYKLASAADSTYVVVDSDVDVDTDGTILESPPITISGLTSGVLYNLRFSNNCSSPIEYFVTTITAP